MKVIRDQIKLKRNFKDDDYLKASASERVSFMWELTAEIWSLKGAKYVKRRLPRNVANLTRQ